MGPTPPPPAGAPRRATTHWRATGATPCTGWRRWALEGGPDGAACERTERDPDLAVDTAALAAVYLGGHRWSTLARARRIEERTAGALATADAMFACDPLPWNAAIF